MSDKKPIVLVDRSKWCCGKRAWRYKLNSSPENVSRLRQRPEDGGGMCCLGFAMRDRGYTDEQLLDKATPGDVSADNPFVQQGYTFEQKSISLGTEATNTVWASTAMEINDNDALTDEKREDYLTELCEDRKAPVKFVFIGEYPE